MNKRLPLLSLLLAAVLFCAAQLPQTGPRDEQGKPVRLTPVPLGATPAAIQAMLEKEHYLYFLPGTYLIGTLEISGWKKGMVWGAGRLTTTLRGSIVINGSRELTIGNFNVVADAPKGGAAIEVTGDKKSGVNLLNTLVSAGREGVAVRLRAPGEFIVQGCNPKGSDIGLSVEHPGAVAYVFGGNFASNRVHIQQVQGHLDARAFGVQGNKGDADIVIRSPSALGYHLIEGVRSEGSNGTNANEVFLQVPPTAAAVNVALQANTLGSMTHYADYNANGTLLLLENVNYPGPEDKSSVGVTGRSPGASNVISVGNKYGLSYDSAPGPFDVRASTTIQSVGDLWMLPNKTDYSKSFNEPVTEAAMRAAGKKIPGGLSFLTTANGGSLHLPQLPAGRLAVCPRIRNLSDLMLNVQTFGALPGDGKDDRAAIQRAMDSAEKGGVSQPLYFPAGRYDLSEPLFLDHLAGGGFWGDGADKSVLASTSGKGVLIADGAGYSTFVDIGFQNKEGAETTTADFDWVNNQSADKRRGNTGAALQANMFYRCRFQNGGIGLAVGRHLMGDGFVVADCVFRTIQTPKGEGAAYASEGFNALTNPIIHSLFENGDRAVLNNKGSFNFYNNRLANIHTAALHFNTIVGNAFAIVNNEMDASPAPFVTTGHSSAKAHLLIDRARLKTPAAAVDATRYSLGGSVLVMASSFVKRNLTSGGSIGDNSLVVYESAAAGAAVSGRAHSYVFGLRISKKE